MIVKDHGTELINILVCVDFVYDSVVAITPVPLVEEHFEKDRRALVPIDDQLHLLPVYECHRLLLRGAEHTQQLLVSLGLLRRLYALFLRLGCHLYF